MSRAGDEHGPLLDLGRERPQLDQQVAAPHVAAVQYVIDGVRAAFGS